MLKQIILIISILSSCNIAYAKELESNFKFKQLDSFNIVDDIPLFDIEGNKHFLEEYEGKAVLLVFWATWCAPCINEMVDLDLLQKDYRKLSFVILPVSEDYAGIEIAKKFYDGYDLRHLALLHDYKNTLFKELRIAGMPTSILINAEGQAVGMFTGSVNWYDENVRHILLSNIPGNPAIPKNSHKDKSLNQVIEPPKEVKKEPEKQVEQKEEEEKSVEEKTNDVKKEKSNDKPNK